MNLLYVILKKEATVNPSTLKSVEAVYKSGDDLETDLPLIGFEAPLNELIAKNYDVYSAKGITHVCIVPDGSSLIEEYRNIVEQYVKDDNTVCMPIVQYYEQAENEDPKFRGLLNTCMWKPYVMNNQYGYVGQELAVKQIDTTLYGSIIPLNVLKKYPFKTKIKYYSFFEYISRLVSKNVVVRGIPKVGVTVVSDDVLKNVPKEEKIKYFTACQTAYKNDEDIEIVDSSQIEVPAK